MFIRMKVSFMSVVIPESAHATALKQVWVHEEPDTVLEERSCINPSTGCALPTDIVNHRLKIAIEVQSAFHDNEKQQIKDAIKKKFWIENGYNFYAVDHREYTIIEIINMFFNYINEIPDYVDFDKKFIRVVQLDMNKNFIKEYESMESAEYLTGCSEGRIGSTLRAGRNYCNGYYWVYKDEYDSGHYNISETILKPIIQLDNDGKFISEYVSISEAAKRTGLSEDNIRACKKMGRSYSCGYHWIYKDDYESGQYELYKGNPKNTPVPIVCFDIEWNFIGRYSSIKDGALATGVKKQNIRQCLYNGRSYSGGYHWLRESDYLKSTNLKYN